MPGGSALLKYPDCLVTIDQLTPLSLCKAFLDLRNNRIPLGQHPVLVAILLIENGKNLVENVLPTRERADLILFKGPDHSVQSVKLRKL